MEATVLTQWVSSPTLSAFCWMLIHSLWIAVMVAALTGLIIILTPHASPKLRYRLFCGNLLLFVLLTGFVFYRQLTLLSSVPTGPALSAAPLRTFDPILLQLNTAYVKDGSAVNGLIAFIDHNAGRIFMLWLLFFLFKTGRMIHGLCYIHRLRTYRVNTPEKHWQRRAADFCTTLGIERTVTLLQSKTVKIPVTVGVLKPVILLPIGLLTQLPVEQIETILWHELAHIKRLDYLVNLVQSLVETVFFFNPALVWLSALIRQEREICCDEIVLEHSDKKSHYLEALLAFEGIAGTSPGPNLVPGFRSAQIKTRLMRIIDGKNQRLNLPETILLFVGLAMITSFSILPKASLKIGQPTAPIEMKRPEPKKALSPLMDSSLSLKQIVFTGKADLLHAELQIKDVKGNRYQVKLNHRQLQAIKVNGVPVASQELTSYQQLLEKAYAEMEKKHVKVTHPGLSSAAIINDQTVQKASVYDRQQEPSRLVAGQEYKDDKERVRAVIALLVREKAVAGPAALEWFGLSEDELIVNGRKQSQALHQTAKERFGIRPDYGLYYGPVQMFGTGVFIDKEEL